MSKYLPLDQLVQAVVFAVIGIIILVAGFFILDKSTPGSLWKELIEDQNTAVAVLMGAMAIGISIIIAAAIIG